jgi:hypothetical protein
MANERRTASRVELVVELYGKTMPLSFSRYLHPACGSPGVTRSAFWW